MSAVDIEEIDQLVLDVVDLFEHVLDVGDRLGYSYFWDHVFA